MSSATTVARSQDELRAVLSTLTPGQAAAAEVLATGGTHAEAAQAARVARETVTRWATRHPGFRAAMATARAALAAETADRIARLRLRALELTEIALNSGDVPLGDALAVLKALGSIYTPVRGEMDAGAIIDDEIRATALGMPSPMHEPSQADHLLADLDGRPAPESPQAVALNRLLVAVGSNDE